MLVIFMTNIGLWSFHSNWLAHELEHNDTLELMTASVDHADVHKIDASADIDEAAPSAMEHQLMHAVDHLQLFPGAIIDGIFSFLPSAVRYHFTVFNVALATFEAPFRPPLALPFLDLAARLSILHRRACAYFRLFSGRENRVLYRLSATQI